MNPIHNSTQFIGICKWTTSHQTTNIANKDTIGIENVVSLRKTDYQHLLALPINSGSFENDAAPILEDPLSLCFSRLHQRVVFNFLTGHGEVEKLLHGLNHQEAIQAPDQKSIFNFLNEDASQCLVFLLDSDLESNSGLDTCGDLSRCFSQLNLENSLDKTACFDNTKQGEQDNGPCSTVSHELHPTDHLALEHLTTDAAAKMNGFTEVFDGNIHSECSFSTSNPFFDSPLHYYQKTFKGDNLSDIISSESNQSYSIENLSGILSKSNCDAEIFEQTTTTYQENLPDFCQHPTNGNSVESTFAIPYPDELMEYLHANLSSPKYLTSDPSLYLGSRSSDEVAKSDNLSDSITNSYGDFGIDNEYDMFDTLGYGTGSEIGAMTGAFGEIETFGYAIGAEIGAMTGAFGEIENRSARTGPVETWTFLTSTLMIMRIYWSCMGSASRMCSSNWSSNWSSREIDSSAFDFDDHQDLLELYGLNEQDVQANDDEFCDSPTWPGKL